MGSGKASTRGRWGPVSTCLWRPELSESAAPSVAVPQSTSTFPS